jgi:hypothetical protein
MATPLVMGPEQQAALNALRDLANAHPVAMSVAMTTTDPVRRRYMQQMERQTVPIPFGFLVTYSIETGHPIGTCRHMSMSTARKDALPSIEAVQWVCTALGFVGHLRDGSHVVRVEDLTGDPQQTREQAVNVIQPLAASEEAGHG